MSWRKGIAKHSKFRNVYGEPYRKDKCYENVKVSKNAWDGTYCSVNPKFLAVVLDTSGAGGAFLVIPLEKVGHQRVDSPRVAGHQREILDIQWNPFNDHIIASASEDTTVKIWRIPSGGLTEDLLEPLVDLHGHQRKVGIIRWHPTANGIIASAGFDFKVIVWNALKAKALCTVDGHRDTIFDLAFNYNGSMMATTSKDKKIRVINSHTGKVIQTFTGHGSPKTSHVSFTDKIGDHLVTTGFSVSGEREISLWDLNKPSSPKQSDAVDHSSSILMLHYDMDIKVAYAAGKGDGMIRYYEVRREEPFLMRLSEYRHSSPQKSLGKMAKRGLDVSRCEIFRFYKLHSNNWIEPLPMLCPRRSDEFQEDLYPPMPSMVPALTADEWMSGIDRDPNLMSFKDAVSHSNGSMSPKTAASSAEKYNSMFNKPAKFEKQLSKDGMFSNGNETNHNAEIAGPTSLITVSKTTVHELQSVNDEEHQKLRQLYNEQVHEIDHLKKSISTKDQRIFKLEQELASKNDELSDIREQYAKKVAELREANNRLASRAQNAVNVVDGRTPAGETTFTRSNETAVQSVPDKPVKRLVEESITSTRRPQQQIDDYEISKALDDAHKEPVRTVPPYGKQAPGSPGEDHRIEDIEAELESLREDLARTREIRHGGKTTVRYISEDESQHTSYDGHSRTVLTEKVSGTEEFSPRAGARGYGSSGVGMTGISENVMSSIGSPPKHESESKRMIITTASYSRVPKHETTEESFGRQISSSTKEKKVSKLIEKFNSHVPLDSPRNSHKRRASGESLVRVPRIQCSRKERPKSAINFEAWGKSDEK